MAAEPDFDGFLCISPIDQLTISRTIRVWVIARRRRMRATVDAGRAIEHEKLLEQRIREMTGEPEMNFDVLFSFYDRRADGRRRDPTLGDRKLLAALEGLVGDV